MDRLHKTEDELIPVQMRVGAAGLRPMIVGAAKIALEKRTRQRIEGKLPIFIFRLTYR
jgi:hypothetical protein